MLTPQIQGHLDPGSGAHYLVNWCCIRYLSSLDILFLIYKGIGYMIPKIPVLFAKSVRWEEKRDDLYFLFSKREILVLYFIFIFIYFFVFLLFLWAAPTAYGGSQARGRIRTVATVVTHAAVARTPDPLTHCARLGIEPESGAAKMLLILLCQSMTSLAPTLKKALLQVPERGQRPLVNPFFL